MKIDNLEREVLIELCKIRGKELILLTTCLLSIVIVLFGGILNSVVIEANGGKMPVIGGIPDESHFNFIESSEVNHYLLTDIINIGSRIYSIGDLIMYSGFCFVVISFLLINIVAHKERKLMK
jgi:hypothetical protein